MSEYKILAPQEILSSIRGEDEQGIPDRETPIDYYNGYTEQYVFLYNADGSICVYDISPDEAKELRKQSLENDGEYWGAFLGWGGGIIDDEQDQKEWMEEYLTVDGWCPIVDGEIDEYLEIF